jgi:hypothetical protein
MAKAGYTVSTNGAVALTGGTARTVLAVLAPAQFGADLKKFSVGFDGVTASAVPALVEVCYLTGATNSTPGTNNTSQTSNILQVYGRSITTGFTAFSASTATFEPTVLTPIRHFLLTPAGGLVLYDWPLGDTPDSAVSQGFAIRCNAPASVNVRAELHFERC